MLYRSEKNPLIKRCYGDDFKMIQDDGDEWIWDGIMGETSIVV